MLQYSYSAPWGDTYPSAYAVCTSANWTRDGQVTTNVGNISAHFRVFKDKASYLAGASPVFESDVTVVGVDVSSLTAMVEQAAQGQFPGSVIVT